MFGLCSCSFLEIDESKIEETQQSEGPSNPAYDNINSKPETWDNLCIEDPNICPVINTTSTVEYSSVQEAYENTVSSIVTIIAYKKNTNARVSIGSGIIYATSTSGDFVYILTNAHVIASKRYAFSFEVLYHNGVKVSADYVVANTVEDIGVIRARVEPNRNYSATKHR